MLRKICPAVFAGLLLCPGVSEARVSLPFEGNIDFQKKEMSVTFHTAEGNPLILQAAQEQEGQYKLWLNIDHFSMKFFDISTILESTVQFVSAPDGGVKSLRGEVQSKYTLMNFKPVKELAGQFEFRNQQLHILDLTAGTVGCRGSVSLQDPHSIDMWLRLSSMDMNDFLAFFVDRSKIVAGGTVDGEIHLSGRPGKIRWAGKLVSYDGFVNKFEYSAIHLVAEGLYPKLNVSGTNIVQPDGFTVNLLGTVDISDKEHIQQQIESLRREPLVSSDGRNLEWTLKKIQSEEKNGSTELKFLHRREKNINQITDGDVGIFGVERKVEF